MLAGLLASCAGPQQLCIYLKTVEILLTPSPCQARSRR